MQLDPVRSAALAAGDRLMNVIGSVDRSDLPPMKDLGEAVRNRIKKRVIDLSSWDRTSWIVSGAPVTAAVWHFAGAWIGIAEEVAGSHLVCMGVNFASDKPELATVAGTDYGVDFAAGLTIRDLQQSKAGLAMPEPNRRELRIDLQALQQ
ncbi:hypothetical protein [Herbihabitans rhizosphaerae]|nr:hypothetical protein [Herbihabitans rhizosphaerae]